LQLIPDSETTESLELVILAVGQQVEPVDGLPSVEDGRIMANPQGWVGGNIFAGGDAVLGPSSLIDAVAQGRQVASTIDRFFGGDGDIDETLLDEAARAWQTNPYIGREDGFSSRHALVPSRETRVSWAEIEQCYPKSSAVAEGLRCLKCNLMHDFGEVVLPPESWHPLNAVAVHAVVAEPGVYFIFDADKQLLSIKGVARLRESLIELFDQLEGGGLFFFTVEKAHYYTQRESELLQAYSEQYGKLPPGIGEDALDDLF
jgi:hypothetical protein